MPQEPQKPSNSGPPPTGDGGSGSNPNPVLLSDVMGRDRSINIFAGMVRDVETATSRLDDVARQSTVLAPRNSAVEALPRKPWEDPDDYGRLGANAYEGDDGRERAARNIRRFVEAHIVTAHPWKEREKVKTMSGEGGEVWWETREGGGKVVSSSLNSLIVDDFLVYYFRLKSMADRRSQIQPGDIEVDSVSSSVENGEVVSQASGLRSPHHLDTKC